VENPIIADSVGFHATDKIVISKTTGRRVSPRVDRFSETWSINTTKELGSILLIGNNIHKLAKAEVLRIVVTRIILFTRKRRVDTQNITVKP
jgi:hypothetical protein